MRSEFTGVGTALITPFTKSGTLDEPAVRQLAQRQVDAAFTFWCRAARPAKRQRYRRQSAGALSRSAWKSQRAARWCSRVLAATTRMK
jgi:hypothetical protein